jgi:DUF4097 and DUF4098 domain-containing protein YvlB
MKSQWVAVLAVPLLALGVTPAGADSIGKYANVQRIEVEGVSADVTIRPAHGRDTEVFLEKAVTPSNALQGLVELHHGTLRIRENWVGRVSSGSAKWTLAIPAGTSPRVRIRISSGNLEANGVGITVDFHSSSGDVRLEDTQIGEGSSFQTSSGDFHLDHVELGARATLHSSSGDISLREVRADDGLDLSTSSGDVTIEGSRGAISGSSSSGSVRVYDSTLDGPAQFSSSSGEIDLRLRNLPHDGLEASSSSGDVQLTTELDKSFTIIMSAREDRGRIVSPLRATSTGSYSKGGRRYVRRVVRHGSGRPEVRLGTATGEVVVKGLR